MHEQNSAIQDNFGISKEWLRLLPKEFAFAQEVAYELRGNFAPDRHDIFRVFQTPPNQVKVLILGQDPYPTRGDAMGLAFSVQSNRPLPRSLKNIFTELSSDLKTPQREDGDLRDWQKQGVFLLNRILTVPIGKPLGHKHLGWERLTDSVLKVLSELNVVALLMGKPAQEAGAVFKNRIETSHPSPLSAYRGFFGSRPFSKINAKLAQPIIWSK